MEGKNIPFKSYAQQKFMYAKHPDIAARWEDKYGALKKPAGYKPKARNAIKKKNKKK